VSRQGRGWCGCSPLVRHTRLFSEIEGKTEELPLIVADVAEVVVGGVVYLVCSPGSHLELASVNLVLSPTSDTCAWLPNTPWYPSISALSHLESNAVFPTFVVWSGLSPPPPATAVSPSYNEAHLVALPAISRVSRLGACFHNGPPCYMPSFLVSTDLLVVYAVDVRSEFLHFGRVLRGV
jgi:hypothetical protein